jgi:hypothetical protein
MSADGAARVVRKKFQRQPTGTLHKPISDQRACQPVFQFPCSCALPDSPVRDGFLRLQLDSDFDFGGRRLNGSTVGDLGRERDVPPFFFVVDVSQQRRPACKRSPALRVGVADISWPLR